MLREYQIAFLSCLDRVTNLYEPVNEVIARLEPKKIVDIATGSGESAIKATEDVRKNGTEVVLTDKYPHEHLKEFTIQEIDVLSNKLPEANLYTMFNAFHHFDESQRLNIALRATEKDSAFLVIEPLRPRITIFIKVLIATLIGPLLLAPFMRPFSWKWILFTYIIPIGILVTAWDGIASVIKSLNKDEWENLEDELTTQGKSVEQGLLSSQFTRLKYFIVT
ncbi:MAG: hypothetical protein AAGC47_00965 [Bacteroidota bacterium]